MDDFHGFTAKDFNGHEQEDSEGSICLDDSSSCWSCFARKEELEQQGKDVIMCCSTCSNNDY